MAKSIRDGKGHRAYRRAAAELKRRCAREGLCCSRCGLPIDTTLPATDPMSFTADHPEALANGGALVGQVLEAMHRRCNSSKGDQTFTTEIWGAT